MKEFKDIIREKRKESNLLLREVASKLKMDQALLSKLERGIRKPTKAQVAQIAKLYKIDFEELFIAWQSDLIAYHLVNEKSVDEILKIAEEKVKYLNE